MTVTGAINVFCPDWFEHLVGETTWRMISLQSSGRMARAFECHTTITEFARTPLPSQRRPRNPAPDST